mmetsp:Transcript_65806/g.109354  ORF Transcript_65806/g.109354 Transcript_65806/m.109354 type:complete len:246 (+) Transcript_65806:462-1199(+)
MRSMSQQKRLRLQDYYTQTNRVMVMPSRGVASREAIVKHEVTHEVMCGAKPNVNPRRVCSSHAAAFREAAHRALKHLESNSSLRLRMQLVYNALHWRNSARRQTRLKLWSRWKARWRSGARHVVKTDVTAKMACSSRTAVSPAAAHHTSRLGAGFGLWLARDSVGIVPLPDKDRLCHPLFPRHLATSSGGRWAKLRCRSAWRLHHVHKYHASLCFPSYPYFLCLLYSSYWYRFHTFQCALLRTHL